MSAQEHWDVLLQVSVGLLVLNTVLKVLGGLERYRFAVVWVEARISKFASIIRPSDLAEGVGHIVGAAIPLILVVLVIAVGLRFLSTLLAEAAWIRYTIALILLWPTFMLLITIVMFLPALLGSWIILIVSLPGLVLSLGSSVSGGRHLTFLSMLTSAAGFVVYVLNDQREYVRAFVLAVPTTVIALEIALRLREREEQRALVSSFREDLAGSVAIALGTTLTSAAAVLALWYFAWSMHRFLFR
jgi:hypothetical protein